MSQALGIPSLSPSRHARLPTTTSVSTQGVSMQNTLPFQSAHVNNTSNTLPTSNIFNNTWPTDGFLQGILNRGTNNHSSNAFNMNSRLPLFNNNPGTVQNNHCQSSFLTQVNCKTPLQSSLTHGNNQFKNSTNNTNNTIANQIFPTQLDLLNNGMQQIQQGIVYCFVLCLLCCVNCIVPSQTIDLYLPSFYHPRLLINRSSRILQLVDATKPIQYGFRHDHSSQKG